MNADRVCIAAPRIVMPNVPIVIPRITVPAGLLAAIIAAMAKEESQQ